MKRKRNNWNKKKRLLIFFLMLLCVFLVALIFIQYLAQDHEAPTIELPSEDRKLKQKEVISVLEGDRACLLEDVVVKDETDSDMSGRLIVSDFQISDDRKYAIITYQAMDYSGNVAYARRIVYLPRQTSTLMEQVGAK